jgi:hypothetical protein
MRWLAALLTGIGLLASAGAAPAPRAGTGAEIRQHLARFEPGFTVVPVGAPARAHAERRHDLPQGLLVLASERLRPRPLRRGRVAHRIAGVPAGRHRLGVWSEHLPIWTRHVALRSRTGGLS